jgi:chaperone required for assembly of F1-ATPase
MASAEPPSSAADDPEATNPMRAAQRLARSELPKRFYAAATVAPAEGGFAILLDGRAVKTPAKRPLVVASRGIAEALAAEWQAQRERIDPGTMPLTRIVNAAIDRVAEEMPAVRASIVSHAGSDLICYRAEGPEGLVKAQEAAWGPLVAFARDDLGARLILAEGIVHARQSEAALAAVDRALEPYDPVALAAIHTITTLTGSAVIAVAVARGRLTPEAAWAAAHVDEDWQMSLWGRDEMALAHRAARFNEMAAAGLILRAI